LQFFARVLLRYVHIDASTPAHFRNHLHIFTGDGFL